MHIFKIIWSRLDATAFYFLNKKVIQALFHFPIIGGFLILLFGFFFVGKGGQVPSIVRRGINAQLFIPLPFAALAFIRYFLWLFDFELVADLLFFLQAIYLIACYAIMLKASFDIFKEREYSYYFFEQYLEKTAKLIF